MADGGQEEMMTDPYGRPINVVLPEAEVATDFEARNKDEQNIYNQLGVDGVMKSRAMRKAVRDSGQDFGRAAIEAARFTPVLGDAIDAAEVYNAYETGKDLQGEDANYKTLGGMAAAGLLLPNILEKPLKAGYRVLKKPVTEALEKGFRAVRGYGDDASKVVRQNKRWKTSPDSFKSDIDWASWNKDTPNHPELMQEYRDVEFNTKKKGTWMKNPDGSDFEGSPEQFVQRQSSFYKEAFPDGGTRVYRGVGANDWKQGPGAPRWDRGGYDPEKSVPSDGTVFASEDLEQARSYQGDDVAYNSPFLSQETYRNPQGGTYDLQAPSGGSDLASDQSGRSYQNLGTTRGDGSFKPRGIRDVSTEKELNSFYSDYNAWAKKNNKGTITDYDKNQTWNNAPNFKNIEEEQAWLKTLPDAASTDDVAEFLASKGGKKYSSFTARDIDDNAVGDVRIHQNRKGNYLKSNVGNVGFFDLNNPDVFKAMIPIIGGAAAMKASRENSNKSL